MERRREAPRRRKTGIMRWFGGNKIPVSDAVYRDLVSTLFTMRLPIAGFGAL